MFNMERGNETPPDVLERFSYYMREISAMSVLFHSRIAEQMGLSATDEKCLDLVSRTEGPVTAGRIAELSGLSTGAVTGVIDRLEKGGFVRRVRDPHDRRKVLVELVPADVEKFAHLFEGARDVIVEVLTHFTSEELEVLERFHRLQIDTFRKRVIER
jgi:DNA-binding MarR family transcriptional regulator